MQQHFGWRMLARFSALTFAALALIAASAKITASTHADKRSDAIHVGAAPQSSQCVATVPKVWGEYRGGSAQSGLAFEDSNGTLRFITNLPCGAVPTVALEIHRSTSYN